MQSFDTLKGKQVLVTGAGGFIGSHLCEALQKTGARVRALTHYNSLHHWGWLEETEALADLEVVHGDVRDPHFCHEVTQGMDMIFNLAALIAIPYSYQVPDSYVDTNVKGTLNICQAAKANRVGRVIQMSTSEVYGSARYVPIDEKHPLQAQSPYSASKIAADAIAMSFYYSFGLPVTIARPFNTYGPRQSARAVIPSIISQIASGRKTLQVGAMFPTRDFNYVKDTCQGLMLLAGCEGAVGETVNIGSNHEISIGDLIAKIKKLMGSDIPIEVSDKRLRPEASEVHRLWCDNEKIKTLTGYAFQYPLEEGLRETIHWFSDGKNIQKYKADLYNV